MLFLTVEPDSKFDKAFEQFLENTWLQKVDGFVSCDSSDDYCKEDLFYGDINCDELKSDQS